MRWSTEAKVGAFALAGIVLFSGMMVELGNIVLFGNKGFDVTGYFEDAEGIEPGSSIQYAGVEVGRVNSIAVKEGQAVLSLRLYEGTQIPKDADFSIQDSSIMGGKIVRVTGGTLSEGYLGPGMSVQGDSGGSMNAAMGKMNKLMDSAQTMMDGLNTIVADPKAQGSVKSTLANVDTMTQNLADITAQGIAIAHQVDGMTQQMNAMLRQFNGDGKAVNDARTILDNLAATSANARSISSQAAQMSGKLSNVMSGENLSADASMLYNVKDNEFSPDFSVKFGGDRFFQLGVESLGNGSLLDASLGQKRGSFDFYGGIIRDKIGGGAAYRNGRWKFNTDLYDPNDLTIRLRGGYEFSPNVSVVEQSILPHSREGGGEYIGLGYTY